MLGVVALLQPLQTWSVNSVESKFVALMCVLLMLAVTWSARRFGYKPEHDHPAPLSEILKALLDSIWAILFPVLLIVLIRFGIMSPTESGSFACAYALLVGTVFYHELTWESLLQTLRDSVKDITVITIILAFSGVFGYGIVFDNITVTIANALLGITSNSAILLLLVVVFLLICGMFMETTVIALILTPILLPVMRSIGVNEVVFGMIMMTTVTFGVMTPPVGTVWTGTALSGPCSAPSPTAIPRAAPPSPSSSSRTSPATTRTPSSAR